MRQAAPRANFTQARWWALAIGVVGTARLLAGAITDRTQFFHSYLFAHLFWLDLSLGCLALVMIRHAVGGIPGVMIQRQLEAGALTVGVMAVLFVPILFGLPELYVWAHPEIVARTAALQHKVSYLNGPFFIARAAAYFAIWTALAVRLRRWSLAQDRSTGPEPKVRLQRLSGLGLILYALTVTFALTDWGMSLDPFWSSTIYGMLGATAQLLTALGFAVATTMLVAHREPLVSVVSASRLRDLSNVMLAGILFLGYMAFSQFLVIWMGNLTEEIRWYTVRIQDGWQWLERVIVVLYAVLFGLLLVVQPLKRSVRASMLVGLLLVVAHVFDRFWSIAPTFSPLSVDWADIAALFAVGGFWMATFFWFLDAAPLVPLGDPQWLAAVRSSPREPMGVRRS